MQPNLPLLIAGALIVSTTWATAEPATRSKPTPVFVAEVTSQSIAERVEALGTLKANESLSLTSNVTETISAVHFDDGQRVKAGDLLVEMTSAEEHALLEEARARAEEAERQYKRVSSLASQRSASQSLLDERKRDLDAARAVLVALESRLADRIIKAPFAGVLGLRQISRGALVEPGDLITTLDDDQVMKLDFSVPSVYLADLKPGLAIEASTAAFGKEVFKGRVGSVDSRVDPVTRSVLVRALIPNPSARLRPGLLMRVSLLMNPRNALVVPESALLHQGPNHFVMVLSEGAQGATAERRQIQIGTRLPGWVEARSGLAAGERVITDGNDRARPGQAVEVLAVDDGNRDLRAMTERRP